MCATLALGQADVSVRVEVEDATSVAGEQVKATLYITNEGDAFRNDLQVSLRLSQSLLFSDVLTPNAVFDRSSLLWAVDQLVTGETDSIRVLLEPQSGGVHTLTAELTSADKLDWDSVPGNDRLSEDDQDQACISVPVKVDCGQALVLRAPKNHPSYTWYRDNEVLAYAIHDTLHPSRSGEYRFELGGGTCASGNCCPVIVDRISCDYDLALVATASDIAQSSAFQTITLTVYNQGLGPVSKVSLYVTTSRFMRLMPGTSGWQLSGTRMTRDWTGMLMPGDSAQVKFDIQAISGGQDADYVMFTEISSFYEGTNLLSDVDSSPDFDPTNDKVINDAYLLDASEDEDDSDIVGLTDCPMTVVSGNRTVCIGESLTLIANANEPTAIYSWSGSDQLNCDSCANPTIIVTEDVDLTLVTTTADGCFQSQVVRVRATNCLNDILLITGVNEPDEACFSIAQGAELQFCDPASVPTGITLSDAHLGNEACVTASTDGTWGGGFNACLEVCTNGVCQPVNLRVIGKPKPDAITAIDGELICISALLQVDQTPIDVKIQGGSNDLQLIPSGNNCYAVEEPTSGFPTSEFVIIHAYEVFGETIFDTTTVTVPGKSVCDFEIFTEDSFTIEADVATNTVGAGQVICLGGNLGALLGANYTINGEPVADPTQGCEAFQVAKYSLRGLPRSWNDNGWRIVSYTAGGGVVLADVYGATMSEVAAQLRSVDPASEVTFTATQLLLEIKDYTDVPGTLVLMHLESGTRLSMQPLIVTGYESWALPIPEGLEVGDYEIAATNAEGCLDIATLNVIEGSANTFVRDTLFATIEINEPYTVCNLDGYDRPSSSWDNLNNECFVFTPNQIGFLGYQAFAKTENGITREVIYALTAGSRTCAPMMVAEIVEVSSSRCRSEYLNLGLTRPDISVTSSSGRVISASQVTGTRAGSRYEFSSLPARGLANNFEVVSWTGVNEAVGVSGNLQAIFQQLREAGLDVDILWDSNTITAGGPGISTLVLKDTGSGQQFTLNPTATALNTYGRFYGRTGNNRVSLSLATCSDQMIAAVKCQIIVWGGGMIFLNGETGTVTSMALAEIDMPDNIATWEILDAPKSLEAQRLPDSSGIYFTVTNNNFVEDKIVLLVRDTAGVNYEVLIELRPESQPCVAEIWREEGYDLVSNPYTGTAELFLPLDFDRDQTTVFVNGTRKFGGFVKRDRVINQAYVVDGLYRKVATPSGKTVEVTGSLEEAMREVLAASPELAVGKAEAGNKLGLLTLNGLEGETRLFGLLIDGTWEPIVPLEQKVVSTYAMLLEPGRYEIELQTTTVGSTCSDKLSVLVKSSSFNTVESDLSLEAGTTEEWCLPPAPAGSTVVAIENVCKDQSGEFASVAWNEKTNCLSVQANEAGTEYLCLKRTYRDGSVDSVNLTLNVRSAKRLALVSDAQEIELGQFGIINVLENDEMSGAPFEISLISEPFYGRAQVVGNRAIEYLHFGNECEKDVFTYEVCQGDVCDSTTVELKVICTELMVYTGISPNGDGINDEFTILGLSKYPEHEITIFDSQGYYLTSFKNYQNDWNGEVDEKPLQSGTYFYVIQLGDGESDSGYIQLSR